MPIPGFTEEETQTLREAAQAGALSDAQKREIIRRSETAAQPEPIPEPVIPDLTIGNVPRESPEGAREAFQMVGGGLGGAAGATAGPGGVLLGGAAGAAAGDLVFNSVDDLLRFAGVIAGDPQRSTEQAVGGALEAAEEDILFGGGFQVAGAAVGAAKPLIGRMLGLRSPGEAQELISAARQSGISVGAVDVTQGLAGRIVRGTSKVLGIFPYIGGPFRKSGAVKAEQVIAGTENILNELAPNAVMGDELGIDMVKAARGTVKEFRKVSGLLYKNFRGLAEDAGPVVPTEDITKSVGEFVQQAERGRITLQTGEELTGSTADALGVFLKDMQDLPERITVEQLQTLGKDLEAFVKQAQNDGFDVLRVVQVKKSLETALNSLDVSKLPEGKGKGLIESLETANSFYAKGIVDFQTPTAQKFARVDKNLARPGPVKAGSINEDEISRVAVGLKSPQAMDDLAKLVGKENMSKAARNHLERAWDNALITDEAGQIKGIDWEQFGKASGVTGRRNEQAQALEKLLSFTDVDIGKVRNLMRVASKITVPKEVNQFIARRAALGGLGSAAAGATVTSIVADSALASLGVAFLLRRGVDLVTTPAGLEAMTRILSPGTATNQKRALLGRLLESSIRTERNDPAFGIGSN